MILNTVALAIGLGLAAQMLAERFKVPAILPLLLLGIAAGPTAIAWIDPESLGDGLPVIIEVGVAVILFEGGLTLDPRQLLAVRGPVRNLLTIGLVITGVGCALLARYVVGVPWSAASLFGAIMTVTGPTVIVPLLRHMIAPREVKTILVSEGLIIDPIGAVLAYLALQMILGAGVPIRELTIQVFKVTVVGSCFGFAAAALTRALVMARAVGEELRNPVIFALLVLCFFASEEIARQSGILAAMVMGFSLSAMKLPDLVKLKAFKGQLTVLLISMLFVLLSAQLDLRAITALGWWSAAAMVGIVFVVRPVSVFLSVWPSQLPLKDRTLLAMTAPRGIVAAAVASLAARQLSLAGATEAGALLEGMVYLTILVTGAWSTLVAIVLPPLLGYADDPSRRRAVLVGANALSDHLGARFHKHGYTTVIVDAVPWRLKQCREGGHETVLGDARDASTYERAGVERDTHVIAATTNDALNILVAELVRDEFGVEHPVVALQEPPGELGTRSRAWLDTLGPRTVDTDGWCQALARGQAKLIDIDPSDSAQLKALRDLVEDDSPDVFPLIGWKGDEPKFDLAAKDQESWSAITVMVARGDDSASLEKLLAEAAERERNDAEPEEETRDD